MKTGKGKNTIPHPLRKTGRKAAKKAQRRTEAEARQAEYDKLDDAQKAAQREYFRARYERTQS